MTDSSTIVILLSDKRSGSTMLQRELCRHPAIRTVEASPHTYLETHHWLKGAVLLGMPAELFGGGKVYPGYGSRANARTYMIDCIRRNIPDFAVPTQDRELVFSGWEALCQRFACPVFFEKSPQLLGHWAALSLLGEWIQTTRFPVKIIGLTRNPMAVLYSAEKLFRTDPAARQFAWLENQRNLLAFASLLPQEDFLSLTYEELVASPKETFARTFRFIGVEACPEAGAKVYRGSETKWREDPDFSLQLHESVRQMARQFGYAYNDLSNLGKNPSTTGRRAQAGIRRHWVLGRARLRDRFLKPLRLRWRSSVKNTPTNEE